MSKQTEVEASGKVFNDNAMAIYQAIHNVESGVCQRVDINDRIKVYQCKNVIRIDVRQM